MTPDAPIPQGIPTGVTPATPVAEAKSPYDLVKETPTTPTTPAVAGEGALDKFFKRLIKFLAKLFGQPDPITGAPNVTAKSSVADKAESFVGKVWDTANKVVDKASTVATQAVDLTKSTVNQAVQQVNEVKTEIAATQEPAKPAQTQPLDTLTPAK